MKVAGIICEYNPFHNGHLYHINKTKEKSDAIICIMSGNFVQRGGPAFCDKFSRAKAAVLSGADLVIELPVVFASRSAEYFAEGAVSILDATGMVDYLSYGCESDNTILFDETAEFKKSLSENLESGVSFPVARSKAAMEVFGIEISSTPNDILAFEYKKALKAANSLIIPLPVKRRYQEYHSMNPSGNFASATYIRQNPASAERYMPVSAHEVIINGKLSDFSLYKILALAHLRTISPDTLSKTADCSEGLENRIISSAVKSTTYDELIDMVKTKRYTRGRIERIIANSMLDIDKGKHKPEYIRVLAANKTGTALIKQITEKSRLPVITNLSKQQIPSKQLETDIKAGNIYSLLTNDKRGGYDFTTSPAVII